MERVGLLEGIVGEEGSDTNARVVESAGAAQHLRLGELAGEGGTREDLVGDHGEVLVAEDVALVKVFEEGEELGVEGGVIGHGEEGGALLVRRDRPETAWLMALSLLN